MWDTIKVIWWTSIMYGRVYGMRCRVTPSKGEELDLFMGDPPRMVDGRLEYLERRG